MDKFYLTAGLFAALLAGCGKHTSRQTVPPLRVEVAEAAVDSVPNRMSFIGYLASNFDAVIQPRVNGYLSSKRYGNGMPVKRGQLLFTIDPDQLSTSMLAAEARLESARAQAIEARNNYDRAVPLAEINAISQSQLDQYTARWKAAEASVRAAEQTLSSARMNVGYAELRSPIDGIVEHTAAHVGDYVGPGTQFSVLTTVSNIDTLTVDVAIPMSQYLRYAGNRASIYDNEGLLSEIRLVLADGVALEQARSLVYTAEADIPQYRRAVEQTWLSMGILLGETPSRAQLSGAGLRLLTDCRPAEIPVGLPSELLKRRPDIREAHFNLLRAAAKAGQARSARFPSISLTAKGGMASSSIKGLTAANPWAWDALASVVEPIFGFGRLRNAERAAMAAYTQSVKSYEQTVLTAFADVEKALVAITTYRDQTGRTGELVLSNDRIATMTRALYRSGLSDYLDVIDAERNLYQTQMELVNLVAQQYINYVTLCKALGGGWNGSDPD